MRRVAENSDTTVSNLYNYFESKDSLFAAIVAPVTNLLEHSFLDMETNDLFKDPYRWSFAWHLEMISQVVDYIDQHRGLLCLLCFKSQGSALEGYVDRLIDRYTAISRQYMVKAKKFFPVIRVSFSDFFVHNISSFMFHTVQEFLMHDVRWTPEFGHLA